MWINKTHRLSDFVWWVILYKLQDFPWKTVWLKSSKNYVSDTRKAVALRLALAFLGWLWAFGPIIWITKLRLKWYWLTSMTHYERTCKNSELIFRGFQWYFSRVFKFSNFWRTKRDSIPLDANGVFVGNFGKSGKLRAIFGAKRIFQNYFCNNL